MIDKLQYFKVKLINNEIVKIAPDLNETIDKINEIIEVINKLTPKE